MPRTDMSASELRAYAPSLPEPPDLASFWAESLAQAQEHPIAARFTRVASGLRTISSYDVTFSGYGGAAVRGWLHVPSYWSQGDDPLPAVVQYQGYGGGRGLVQEDTFWASGGYAHLIMGTRGQGSGWSCGDTPEPDGSAPYAEIERYLACHRDQAETVFRTLSYFDAAVLGKRANARALFSVAHMDQTCPPSTVYAAFNAYGGPKQICDYEFNDHEGGQIWQRVRQLHWLAATLQVAGRA